MATQNAYGTFSPAALQPYPIETELEKQAYGGDTAQSQTQLDQYWLERQAHENLYGQELDAQHQQARNQLAATMYEQNIKGLTELGKMPGGLQIAQSSPYYQGILGGASPDIVGNVIAQQQKAQDATNLEHAGSGVNSLTTAGFQPDQQYVTNLTGAPTIKTAPVPIQVANINAASRVAAANARAGAANQPSVSLQVAPIPGLGTPTLNVPGKLNMGAGDVQKFLSDRGYIQPQVQLTPPSQTGGMPPPTAVPTTSTGAVGTRLPPAKTETAPPTVATSGPAPAAQAATGNNAAAMTGVRNWIETNKAQMPPAAYADITGAYSQNGGNPKIIVGPDGKPAIIGKSGKAYR